MPAHGGRGDRQSRGKWMSEKDFKEHRKLITELYYQTTLPNLMQTLETQHGLCAAPKMYRSRFRRWGLWKHDQDDDMVRSIGQNQQRDAVQAPSQFVLRSRRATRSGIEPSTSRHPETSVCIPASDAVLQGSHRGTRSALQLPAAPVPTMTATAVPLSAAIYRAPTPEPGGSYELRNEELMYRAIRDYYHGSFSAQRWAFDNPCNQGEEAGQNALSVRRLAVERTKHLFKAGEETWLRFRAAVDLLERPLQVDGASKEDDFAQGVRLIRIAFAELSHILSECEPPLLFVWLMQIMILFRESLARDFRPIETQLLKHLHDLTSTAVGQPRHATALLWRILWSGGRGIPRERHHLRACTAIALESFTQHLGSTHPWTIELSNFSIYTWSAPGSGDPEYKTTRYRRLLQHLETLDTYDSRHLNVVCCWANHYWHHGKKDPDSGMFQKAISLLHGVLRDPRKAQSVTDHPEAGFNVYSLLTSIHNRLNQWDMAEWCVRRAIRLGEREMARTGANGDLFEALIRLEMVLRAQGRDAEADAAEEERKALAKTSLEKVGETEDGVQSGVE